MRIKSILLSSVLIFLISCAAYKELEPDPAIRFFEDGYIELKDDDEFFELDEDGKYFIKFPPALTNNIYLVLEIDPKSMISSYLTDRFDDGKGYIKRLPDMTTDSEKYSVFALDQSALNYFWVIESVRSDLILECKYRFIAAWRYKFENSYSKLLSEFEENQVQKDIYNSLGTEIHSDQIAIEQELQNLQSKKQNLTKITNSMQEIENILPDNIINSSDQAYQDYVDLKNKLAEEIEFQNQYQKTLSVLKAEQEFRSDPAKFSTAIPELLAFYSENNPSNVESELSSLISPQLKSVVTYFDKQLKNKNDKNSIDLDAKGLEDLFIKTGKTIPHELSTISNYVTNFSDRVNALNNVSDALTEIKSSIKSAKSWPSSSFYPSLNSKLGKIRSQLPKTGNKSSFGYYRNTKSARLLNSSITSTKNEIIKLGRQYDLAGDLVPQINQLKERSNYRGIIKILKNNRNLDFLRAQYSNVDKLSLEQQKNGILSALRQNDFASVESGLRSLYNDTYFLNMKSANKFKRGLIKTTEDTVMNRIERQSKKRAQEFVEQNYTRYNGVEEMYANEAFAPVHNLNFTSGDPTRLNQRKQKMVNNLENLKTVLFPEKSIEALYKEFTANTSNYGVQRARAIVAHGKHYKGADKKIKNLVGECDPTASKWITKAKSYRKVYVLPYTSNQTGANEYIFKFNIRIPSEARFPVFDINIKLPKEIAKSAHEQQWYEKITMNGKILKNEGRFSIVAPTADNNYECQITPVQMDKDKDNVLEVRFNHSSFKVFEVSAMAQKPIIKKN